VPKVLVSDKTAPQGIEILEQTPGLEVTYEPGIDPGDLLERIDEFEGLVIRSGTKVTAEVSPAPTGCAWWAAPGSAWTTSTCPPPPSAASW